MLAFFALYYPIIVSIDYLNAKRHKHLKMLDENQEGNISAIANPGVGKFP